MAGKAEGAGICGDTILSGVAKVAVKTIGLLSGGLDSTLATRIMKKLGFDVLALNFMSPFCTCTRSDHGCKNEAKRLADELGMKVRVEFMGEEYIDIVRNPEHGYGKNMNPCIDCRLMMFKRTKEIMEEEGAAFIFTGEVVGQRPMSQREDRMRMIERDSGLSGLIVRPLCAQLLPPTIPEKEGIINRDEMLAIRGRSRKPQIQIAKDEFGMTENLCSSGGCLLTDPGFAKKMKDLVTFDDTANVKDARLLRLGRHFRISDELKLVVGRNESENEKLLKIAAPEDFIFYPTEISGPTAVAKGKLTREAVYMAAGITARYCSGVNGDPVRIDYKNKGNDTIWSVLAKPVPEEELNVLRI